ncbi:hypothetical protein [Microbacterium halotolerans]|uniref:hypothetical protein n=1 Tax=Microbacterium halotolerans TaxID=246613 RepID=UPI000E6AD561|nr:hypothetical protein [Microbacterium halotolerans]
MAAREIDENAALAHEHAQAAVRHAGRVAVARETLAITAYRTGDFSLTLRELRTLRRITGRNEHIAMIVDSERGVGRPEKALEEGTGAQRDELDTAQRVQLAIAMSGARLDLGQTELALAELDINELDPDLAYSWSPGLFAARAAVLEDLGLTDEAEEWARRADVAAEAIAQELARDDELIVEEIPEMEISEMEVDEDGKNGTSDASADGVAPAGAETDEGAAAVVDGSTAPTVSAERDDGPVEDAAASAAEENRAVVLDAESGLVQDGDSDAAETAAMDPADPVEHDDVIAPAGGGHDSADEEHGDIEDESANAADDSAKGADSDAAPDPDVAVEDEVSEILVEAGIDEPAGADAQPAAAEAEHEEQPAAGTDAQKGDERPDGALF